MHVHWGTEIKIVNCLYLLLSHSLFPTRFAYNCCQLFTQLIVFFAFVLISHGAFFPISDSFSVDFILTSILFIFSFSLPWSSPQQYVFVFHLSLSLALHLCVITHSVSIKTLCFCRRTFFSSLNIHFPIEWVCWMQTHRLYYTHALEYMYMVGAHMGLSTWNNARICECCALPC